MRTSVYVNIHLAAMAAESAKYIPTIYVNQDCKQKISVCYLFISPTTHYPLFGCREARQPQILEL